MESLKTHLSNTRRSIWLLLLALANIVIIGSILFLVFSENGLLTQIKNPKPSATQDFQTAGIGALKTLL